MRTCETHALEEEAVREGGGKKKNLLYVAKDADVVGFHEVYCHTLPPIPFRKEKKKIRKNKKKEKRKTWGEMCVYTGVLYEWALYITGVR